LKMENATFMLEFNPSISSEL